MKYDPEYIAKWGLGPHLAVDAFIYCIDSNKIVLVQRKDCSWALPGGFVEPEETIETALIREVKEETGLTLQKHNIEFSHIEDDVFRDKRARIISHIYKYEISWVRLLQCGDDAIDAKWIHILNLPENMYADHRKIIAKCLNLK